MKVIVNPNYDGKGWFDPRSEINFMKQKGAIEIPKGANTLNIDRYIKLNYLVVVEEDIIEEVKQPVELTTKTPAQLLAEEEPEATEPVEAVEEPEAEEIVEEVIEVVAEEIVEPEEEQPAEAEDIKEVPEVEKHICMYCEKELKTAAGRAAHERACKKNPENN